MKIGERYESKIWLNPNFKNCPAIMKFTRITKTVIHYRPDYGQHDDGSEWLGTSTWIRNTPQAINRYLGRQIT